MKINSLMLKSLVMILFLHFLTGQANAQKDSTWYFFADAQITLLNSFQTLDFSKDWTNSSEKTGITSFGAGILFRSRSVHKNWSGFNFSVSSTAANALFRSKYVSYVEQGRTYSYTMTEGLSLKMISAGYYFARAFNANERSGFFINPAILFGTMKEKFNRDIISESDVKATGFELTTGVAWFPISEVGLKAVIGYRAIKMKIDAFESTGEIINWSGPFLGAGICIALP